MNIIEKWKCGECGDLHSDEDEARDCCPVSIYEVYQCPICKEHHPDSAAAEECLASCKEENPEFRYMASIQELEDLGQQRLFS